MSDMPVLTALVLMLVVLTMIQVCLLSSVLKWQKLIGISLGCNPSRSAAIVEAGNKLLHAKSMSSEERQGLEHSYKTLSEDENLANPVKGWHFNQMKEQIESLMELVRKRLG